MADDANYQDVLEKKLQAKTFLAIHSTKLN